MNYAAIEWTRLSTQNTRQEAHVELLDPPQSLALVNVDYIRGEAAV